jgi:hypothetical protein
MTWRETLVCVAARCRKRANGKREAAANPKAAIGRGREFIAAAMALELIADDLEELAKLDTRAAFYILRSWAK